MILSSAWLAGPAANRRVVAFYFSEDRLRAIDHTEGQAGEPGDLDAVTAVGGAGDDTADKHDLVVPFLHRDGEVAETRQVLLELRELLVVGRE